MSLVATLLENLRSGDFNPDGVKHLTEQINRARAGGEHEYRLGIGESAYIEDLKKLGIQVHFELDEYLLPKLTVLLKDCDALVE